MKGKKEGLVEGDCIWLAFEGVWSKLHFSVLHRYALNCLVFGDVDGVIRMVLPAWPGSFHDSRIYRVAEGRRLMEAQDRFMIAADSAFPLTPVSFDLFALEIRIRIRRFTPLFPLIQTTITPYPRTRDRAKNLFNRKLSGLRTKATENIFGRWKRR